MKIAIIADPHVHNYNGDPGRMKKCMAPFIQASNDYDYILMPGDLFDRQEQIPTVVINYVTETIQEILSSGTTIIAISGNHDHATLNYYEKPAESILTYLSISYPGQFVVIDNDSYKLPDGTRVYGIPYYKQKSDFDKAYKNLKPPMGSVLMIHQTPAGIMNEFIHPDVDPEEFKNLKMVFCGHIHRHQRLADNFVVVGSPVFRDLGDIDDPKGYLIYDTQEGSYDRIITDHVVPENKKVKKKGKIQEDLSSPESFDDRFNKDISLEDLIKNYLGELGIKDPQIEGAGIRCIKKLII